MKRNKFIVLCIILSIFTGFIFADTKDTKPPTKNEIVLVFSVKVLPAPSTEFFSNYRNVQFGRIGSGADGIIADKIRLEGANRRMKLSVISDEDAKSVDFSMYKLPFAYGKRYIEIHNLLYLFAGSGIAFINLPIHSKIEVREGVKYVYLGDFIVKCKTPFYDISEVKRSDNFDAAALAVKKRYGEDAELERVPLVPLQ
ncbi:hypothetical protein [Treponema pedis]|uniref:Lipoprotein n=1 Tax=Treponema pedis TaxID=409322 RepID=A0A7S6WNP1_9SPIR|nr:hypothetical protein [Treponema pedis]QOW60509.1 hypothetical protein IFE08_11965 [Treponema pedis]